MHPQVRSIRQARAHPSVATDLVLDGVAHGLMHVPPARVAAVREHPDLRLVPYDTHRWWFVALNTTKEPLSRPGVREALDLVVDRNSLCERTVGGGCTMLSGPFLPGSPYLNRSIVPPRPDSDRAQELLFDAGLDLVPGDRHWHLDGQPITLRIGGHANLDAESRGLLVALAGQLERAGFLTELYTVAPDVWRTKVLTGNQMAYDLVVGTWSLGPSQDVGSLFHSRDGELGQANIFGFSHPRVDGLLERMVRAESDSAAQVLGWELHAALAQQRPYLFLWTLESWSAWSRRLDGVVLTPRTAFDTVEGWHLR